MRENGVLTWLISDHLGSTGISANADGASPSTVKYGAFGEIRAASGNTSSDYLYTGQRSEAELGLYYYGARFYDPSLGRFIQADTIVPQPGNPLAWDRYAYTLNNPVRYVDPSGHMQSCGDKFDESCNPGFDTPINPWRLPPEESAIGRIKAAGANDDYIQLLFYFSAIPVRISGANPRNFGDNRGKYERDIFPELDRYHMAIDIGYNVGDPVYPFAYGTIVASGYSKDFGYYIVVEHNVKGQKYYSVYAHLGTGPNQTGINVNNGNVVGVNTQIGTTGNTKPGMTDMNPHLHFEIRTQNNINIGAKNPFGTYRFWGYSSPDWFIYFVNLGELYGYDQDYKYIP